MPEPESPSPTEGADPSAKAAPSPRLSPPNSPPKDSAPKPLWEWYVRRSRDPLMCEIYLSWDGGSVHLEMNATAAHDLSDRLLVLAADLVNRKDPETPPNPLST